MSRTTASNRRSYPNSSARVCAMRSSSCPTHKNTSNTVINRAGPTEWCRTMLHLGDLQTTKQGRAAAHELDWPKRFAMLAETSRDPRLKAFYTQGMPTGDSLLQDVPLAALDVETTGLDPMHDEIVSIGVMPMTMAHIQS